MKLIEYGIDYLPPKRPKQSIKVREMSDIFTAVKPLLYVSTVLGLSPFFIDEESKSLRVCKYRVGYSVAMTVIFACCSVYGLFRSVENSTRDFSRIREYTYVVLLSCGIIVGVCTLVLAVVQRNKIVAMVAKFREVDSQMAKLGVLMPYERVFRHCCGWTVGLFILLVMLLAHDAIAISTKTAYFWVCYFGPVIYSTYMEYQFIGSGLLLRKNFAFLNDRLTKFGTEVGQPDGDGKKLELIDSGYDGYFESHLIRKSAEEPITAWENNLSRYRIRKILPRDVQTAPALPSLTQIKIIRKVHSTLCEVKELLNSSYSLQLLTVVAQAFVIITTNLYELFTNGNIIGEKLNMSYSIVWALFRSMELICITVTCTKISKTANHTAVIVHKLLSQDWDPTIRNQLKLFSIQLLHRKISFSACGFFTLDMTLLHAIIGAATTYLVILIQFHNTYENT